jgi:hypothetical protein
MHMNEWSRALSTLLAAGIAGFLLWLAAQFNMHHTGGYWAAIGVIAGGGLLLALARLRGMGGNPLPMMLVCFLPTLICAGWVIIAMQPQANWFRDHVTSWSSDMGILGAVRDIGTFNGVLAFGVGLVFGYALEPGIAFGRRRREVVAEEPAPARRPLPMDRTAADEPTAAERDEAATADTSTVERTETTVR